MIHWEKGELCENHGHDKMYCASAEDEQGTCYGGTWYECDGIFIQILNIEKL